MTDEAMSYELRTSEFEAMGNATIYTPRLFVCVVRLMSKTYLLCKYQLCGGLVLFPLYTKCHP